MKCRHLLTPCVLLVWILACSDDRPTSPSSPTSIDPAVGTTSELTVLGDSFEIQGCGQADKLAMRFSQPGFIAGTLVGMYLNMEGLPAGEKKLRIWWDYDNNPERFQTVSLDDETNIEFNPPFEHEYVGAKIGDVFKVRILVMSDASTKDCSRVRTITLKSGDVPQTKTAALAGGCSSMATWSHELAPDLWFCAFNASTGKTWVETYGVCNESGGFHLASVGPMTRRGAPPDADIGAAMTAAIANGHDFITTGQPTRSCGWDSTATNYETCNGLGYLHTVSDATSAGSNWVALLDGNDAGFRSWPSANSTGAHRLASLCMNASSDSSSSVFDHRWR